MLHLLPQLLLAVRALPEAIVLEHASRHVGRQLLLLLMLRCGERRAAADWGAVVVCALGGSTAGALLLSACNACSYVLLLLLRLLLLFLHIVLQHRCIYSAMLFKHGWHAWRLVLGVRCCLRADTAAAPSCCGCCTQA
jgi:hypothetical protein